MVLSYNLKAFSRDYMFHLSLYRPTNLPYAKKKVKVLDDSWKSIGRPDTSGYSKEKPEPTIKGKTPTFSEGLDLMIILIEQNRLVRKGPTT